MEHTNKLPRSVLKTDRETLESAPMTVLGGKLPKDLTGHYFVMAAAGDIDSGGLPRTPGKSTTVLAGDGLVTRIDLDGSSAKLSRKLLQPPDLLIEQMSEAWLNDGEEKPDANSTAKMRRWLQGKLGIGFNNWGIARMSLLLGCRNQLSTAIEVLCKPGQDPRLLVCWDAGAPWEIDPTTLELITPVGERADWVSTLGSTVTTDRWKVGWPFPLNFSTAHPAIDRHTGEAFFVSWSRSLTSLMVQLPYLRDVVDVFERLNQSRINRMALAAGFDALNTQSSFKHRWQAWKEEFAHKISGGDFVNVVTLLKWDGEGAMQRWFVTDEHDAGLKLEETMHQVGVTENHIVLCDTGFKVGPQSLLAEMPGLGMLSRWFRLAFSEAMEENARLWIVARKDLVAGNEAVRAKTITVPVGIVHFATDYSEGPDGQIRIHTAHSAASDVAEWVHKSDLNLYTGEAVDEAVVGCWALGVMDGNRLGTLNIEADTGDVKRSLIGFPEPEHWGLGLGATKGGCTAEANPDRLERTFWTSVGFWPELYTRQIFALYHDYTHRMTPVRQLIEMGKGGPENPRSSVYSYESETGAVLDKFVATKEMFFSSPQLLGDKYLGLMVWREPKNADELPVEFWIMDQNDLAAGPLCRLGHAEWVQGFTMHAAWLAELPKQRPSDYQISVTDDLKEFLSGWHVPYVRNKLVGLVEEWERNPPGPWAGPGKKKL